MSDLFATAVFGDGSRPKPFRRALAERTTTREQQRNDFVALKHGLDTYRSHFYRSTTSRLPNTNASDLTRRQRTLEGGPGDRHLTGLDLWTERELSRYLRDQSPMFDGMIQTWAAETIQSGFRLKPRTGDDDLDTLVREVLLGWDGDGGWLAECDARGMHHFWDLLTLAEETELTDGDHAFYLDPDGNDGRGSVAIIEGDRILTPYGLKLAEGFAIINGVILDGSGRPVGVWVADQAPSHHCASIESGRVYRMFDERQPQLGGVVFSVELKRYTATRRQPWLSTAIRPHDEIDDVFTAVRVLLRNAACRATYTRIADWEAYSNWLEAVDSVYDAPAPTEALSHSPNPGDHVNLNPGEEGGVYETNAPGENFDPFMQLQLTMIGLPLGMAIEESARIFQKSFAASRMAVDGTRRRYRRRQRRIKRRKLSPVLSFAVARHQAVGVFPDDPRCFRILCGFPGWQYMEPLKDAKADEIRVNARLRSRRTTATAAGDDWDMERELIREERDEFGTPPASDATGFEGDAE